MCGTIDFYKKQMKKKRRRQGMKKKFLALMLSVVTVIGAPVMTVSAEVEEVVIPEYSTVDYDVDFQYELDGIDALKETCDQQGTVEELTYEAPAYATNELLGTDSTIEKTVQVYLPYGYDESKQYNVLYLLHGTGGNDKYWFETAKGADGSENVTSNVLDNMIKKGLCDPVIVVTPNFYSEIMDKDHKISDDAVVEYGKENGDDFLKVRNDLWTQFFQYELRNDIMPLVESTYSTYAGKDTSEESMIASRDHRALAGLSRGAMATTRSGMLGNLDEISYFGNYSGVWAMFDKFKDTVAGSEYKVNYWYNGTGTADFAAENHLEFHNQVMAEMSDTFTDGENYAMVVKNGGAQEYGNWIVDLYNSLLVFFK